MEVYDAFENAIDPNCAGADSGGVFEAEVAEHTTIFHVLNPLNRRCSSGGAGDICDPVRPSHPISSYDRSFRLTD